MPKQGGQPYLSGTHGWPISSPPRVQLEQHLMSYRMSHTHPNIDEVCSNFLNIAFERKLKADIELLYCLDDPDCVFKHVCSAEIWTGFFEEKELCRALRVIRRCCLPFLNSEESCDVQKNWSERSKEKGRQLADWHLSLFKRNSFAAFVDKNKLLPYFKGLLANYPNHRGITLWLVKDVYLF